MEYVPAPLAVTGQVLGKSYLRIFSDNDQYFMGVADGKRCVPTGRIQGWIAQELICNVWLGYHLLAEDATLLHYYWEVTGSGAGGEITNTVLKYNNVVVDWMGGNGTKSGTYSLAAVDPGIYQVLLTMERDDGSYSPNTQVTCRAPYTTYTGAEAYAIPDDTVDGFASSADQFNHWRSNDAYFNACTPRQPAFSGMSSAYVDETLTRVLWDGWDCFHDNHNKMFWGMYLDDSLTPTDFRIVYDVGGEDEVCGVKTTPGFEEGTHELTGAYVNGSWYHVRAVVTRGEDTNWGPEAGLYYIRMGPAAGHEMVGFTVMDEFAVGQWVYGSTAGQLTRLQLLSDNDVVIYPALCWADPNIGRRDFAVCQPQLTRYGAVDYGSLRFVHQRHGLYYYGVGGTLFWGETGKHKLDPTLNYLDLGTLPDFPLGMNYYIDGIDCYFAMEA